MRTVGILVAWCLLLGGGACKNNSDASSAAPDPASIKAQQELVARRDALLAQREKLQDEADTLQAEIRKVEATGGDTSELTKKKAAIETQIQEQDKNLASTSTDLSALSSKLDAAGGVAAREARVADRERVIAERERAIADRERALAVRDGESARRWAESCSAGGTTTIIQQAAPPPKGGNYTRAEVDKLFGRAKTAMSKKGLVPSDLGAQASLEGEVTKALAESDWTRGYILASQLAQTIDGIQINRPFIKAKYDRLAARARGTKLDESTQSKLETGMKAVMQKYGDGDFITANRLINDLWRDVR